MQEMANAATIIDYATWLGIITGRKYYTYIKQLP